MTEATYEKQCPVCNDRFLGIKLAVYCTKACKLKAWRRRRIEHVRKHNREYMRKRRATT